MWTEHIHLPQQQRSENVNDVRSESADESTADLEHQSWPLHPRGWSAKKLDKRLALIEPNLIPDETLFFIGDCGTALNPHFAITNMRILTHDGVSSPISTPLRDIESFAVTGLADIIQINRVDGVVKKLSTVTKRDIPALERAFAAARANAKAIQPETFIPGLGSGREAILETVELEGVTLGRTANGLILTATTRLGKTSIGADYVAVPYDAFGTIELLSDRKIRLVWDMTRKSFGVPKDMAVKIEPFVAAVAAAHAEVAGRSAGTGAKLTRQERKKLQAGMKDAVLEQRLASVQEALLAGDIHAEGLETARVKNWARSQRLDGGEARVEEAIAALRAQHGIRNPQPVARFGKVTLYDDRIVRGTDAYPIDEHTTAEVFLDGQKQIVTRASLTSAAIGSILPGSAIIPALAAPSKKTHDLRSAQLIIGSTSWSWPLQIHPDAAGAARAFAQRVNALAAQRRSMTTAPTELSIDPAPDVLTQLERLAKLQEAGLVTADEAASLKATILAEG